MNQKIKIYFIGGLGSNYYFAKDFFQELEVETIFLNPYKEIIQDKKELQNWFNDEVRDCEEVYLIGHSLGGDLARFLASRCSKVTKLILLDGGYLNLDEIMPLENEIEATKDYFSQHTFSNLEEVIANEKSKSYYWSENLEEALRNSYRYNNTSDKFELDLDFEKVSCLLKLRRAIRSYQRNLESKDVLFIAPAYEEEPEWRKISLDKLPKYFDVELVENCGHEMYMNHPIEIATIVHSWINKK